MTANHPAGLLPEATGQSGATPRLDDFKIAPDGAKWAAVMSRRQADGCA